MSSCIPLGAAPIITLLIVLLFYAASACFHTVSPWACSHRMAVNEIFNDKLNDLGANLAHDGTVNRHYRICTSVASRELQMPLTQP